jgi:glycosyltransferase involved in cell wall biosynthesis
VVAVSASLGARYVALGLAPARAVQTAGAGSSNGIVAERFAAPDPDAVAALRARLGLPEGTPVVGFVGRFTRDKGIAELVEAFGLLRAERPALRLLLVGSPEPGDPVAPDVLAHIDADPAIQTPGFLPDTAASYALMRVLAFPSHREGFPNVPLEAAAAGLPVVAARATGSVDAVVDGATGALVPLGDAAGLARALGRYLDDPALAAAHGRAGQARARDDFRPDAVWDSLDTLYRRLLASAP